MPDEAKIYKDAMYSYKELAYNRREALKRIAFIMEDPNEPPEEKIRKAIEVLEFTGSMPKFTDQG